MTPLDVTIRPETPADADGVRDLHVRCFPSDAEAHLVERLRAAGRLSLSLVAEVAGAVVGHVAFSPATTASGATGAGMAPLAVDPAHRRRGIAAELVREGLRRCEAVGVGWVVVLGEPAYYERFGFRNASDCGLEDEYGGGPAFQIVELKAGTLPAGGGLVRYAPEFEAFE